MKLVVFLLFLIASCFAEEVALSRDAAEAMVREKWQKKLETLRRERAGEMEKKQITVGDKTMRFMQREIGEAPDNGRPLVISMHGGGSAPAAVNDAQWQNQIRLYDPEGSLYIAPRAPTNTWNLWHEEHIDGLFDRLIENCIAIHRINPDRVYIMGYSAGGDGVYQIGPRMADRWAAAAMMAGHPNEAKPDSLRNLPFALQVGAKDTAFKRNEVCQQWADQLSALAKAHEGSYLHFFKSYPQYGHWMNREDAVAVPWMLKFTREAWPKAITWHQDDVVGTRFYWLSVDPALAKKGQRIEAQCIGQKITIQTNEPNEISLRLSDSMLDLAQEVVVEWNGKQVFCDKVKRSAEAIDLSLQQRADPSTIATALLKVKMAP
jgi:poly(3-hydroxybutyrate) depolymerase